MGLLAMGMWSGKCRPQGGSCKPTSAYQVGDASYVPPEHLFLALKLHILNAKKCLFILQHISRVKGSSSQPSGLKLHLQPQFKVA